MTEFSAHDVARELRALLPNCGVVKLHKLLYYCQGWNLAWSGSPMFQEKVVAWVNGPVVASLWADEKYDRGRPHRRDLGPDSLATVRYVIQRYGHLSGRELIRLSHQEAPWREVSESDDSFQPDDPEITHEALQRWFEQDEDYLAHRAEVVRLRERKDIYGFEPLVLTPELKLAMSRFVSPEEVQRSRPA